MNKSEQINNLLTRGVSEVIDRAHLEARLRVGKKLRVKLGIDPTSPNIHIGRAVSLWKLRQFQELGHKAVFIVGDFTGIVGDSSDKDSERPMLTEKQIKENLKTYFAQAFKILDKSKTETYYNSKWLKKLGFIELARMASKFSLREFESREVIARRMKAGKEVSFHELMYPLMQGYDSVAVKADVELGGTDQRFNLLAGRVIQKMYEQEPQDILMTEILEGLDGRKMSSSWGNTINIADEANDMFGKVMSLGDNLIARYFLLATATPETEIKRVISENKNPRDQKIILAQVITSLYHGEKKAVQAKNNFIAQFSNKELPTDMPSVSLKPGTYDVFTLLVENKLAASKAEARRLFEQKGIKLDSATLDEKEIVKEKNKPLVLQVGKRRFVRFE